MSLLVLNPAPLDALAEDLGDPVAVASMLSTFCDSTHLLNRAADDVRAAHDLDALHSALRDLAATAAMFGAEHLASTSRDLAARVGDTDRPVTSDSLRRLTDECVSARRAVRRYVAGTAYDDGTGLRPVGLR